MCTHHIAWPFRSGDRQWFWFLSDGNWHIRIPSRRWRCYYRPYKRISSISHCPVCYPSHQPKHRHGPFHLKTYRFWHHPRWFRHNNRTYRWPCYRGKWFYRATLSWRSHYNYGRDHHLISSFGQVRIKRAKLLSLSSDLCFSPCPLHWTPRNWWFRKSGRYLHPTWKRLTPIKGVCSNLSMQNFTFTRHLRLADFRLPDSLSHRTKTEGSQPQNASHNDSFFIALLFNDAQM